MIDPDESAAAGMPMTARAVFIVSPDHKLKLSILHVPDLYPSTTLVPPWYYPSTTLVLP